MPQLPAVVTIPDLTPATTVSSAALFEAAQTTNGVLESVSVSLNQIMTTAFGGLPTGGTTGQFLAKFGTADFAAQWRTIVGSDLPNPSVLTLGGVFSAPATATSVLSGIDNAGTPTLATVTGTGNVILSNHPTLTNPNFTGVVTVNGNTFATSPPGSPNTLYSKTGLGLQIVNGAGNAVLFSISDTGVVSYNIAGQVTASTGIAIAGSTTIAVSFATTTPLSVLGVAGTATAVPLPIVGVAGQVLRVNAAGTAVEFGAVNLASSAAVTGVLPLANGGWSTSTLTAFGVVYGNGTSTPGITAAGTTAWALLGNGTALAPSFQQVSLTASVTGVLTVPFGGTGITAMVTGDILYASNNTTLVRLAAATSGFVLTANGTGLAPSYQTSAGGTAKFFGGRLTLQSGTPVPVTDAAAQSTIFFEPYGGNANLFSIPTSATGSFVTHQFTQRSLALDPASVTSGNLYDICLATTAGAFFFGHGPAWTSTTARSAAFTTVEGVWVNAAPITLRANATTTTSIGTSLAVLVGTIGATANGQTSDTLTVRNVWNNFNRVDRPMRRLEPTDSWTYTSATWRQANGSTANQLDFVRGMDEDAVMAFVYAAASNTNAGGGVAVASGIGLSTTTAPATGAVMGVYQTQTAALIIATQCNLTNIPGLGKQFLAWLEYSSAVATTTWYGDAGAPTVQQTGIYAMVRA